MSQACTENLALAYITTLVYFDMFYSFSNGFVCCRQSSLVQVYAWSEEESSCKIERGVDGQMATLLM